MISLNKEVLKHWQEHGLEELRYGYDLLPSDTVLDIGSYQREWGHRIEIDYGCKVEYFDALENRAAWLFDGTLEMGGAYYYTSMFAESKPFKYGCVDIAPYIQKEVALVKINIEGGEYELLNYICDSGLMGNIIDLQVQFHLIEGRDSKKEYDELTTKLRKTHEISWCYPFVWESWQRKQEYQRQYHSV
jgi:hypothetical protein